MVDNWAAVLEWARFLATIVTPFAVFWLGALSIKRKEIVTGIDKKLEEMRKEIADNRQECREDTAALTAQLASFQQENSTFQRTIVGDYVKRSEIQDGFRELRNEIGRLRK